MIGKVWISVRIRREQSYSGTKFRGKYGKKRLGRCDFASSWAKAHSGTGKMIDL